MEVTEEVAKFRQIKCVPVGKVVGSGVGVVALGVESTAEVLAGGTEIVQVDFEFACFALEDCTGGGAEALAKQVWGDEEAVGGVVGAVAEELSVVFDDVGVEFGGHVEWDDVAEGVVFGN